MHDPVGSVDRQVWRNGSASEGARTIPEETALALQPDAIVISEGEGNKQPNKVFKDSPAVRNKKVFVIDGDLLSRPGPRLVDALEQIAQKLQSSETQ